MRDTAEPATFPLIKAPDGTPDSQWLDRASQAYHRVGCLHVGGVLDPKAIGEMKDALLLQHARHLEEKVHADALGVGNRRVMVTPVVDGPFNSPDLYANRVLLPLMQRLLSPNVVVHNFGAVLALPGAADQHVHRDQGPELFQAMEMPIVTGGSLDTVPRLPPHAITVTVPLIGMSPLYGTTRMWPGSHYDCGQWSKDDPAVDPVAVPGDVVLMDYRLLHAGMANRSDVVRPLLYVVYGRPWYCDWRNFRKQPRLLMSDAAFEQVPEPHRHMFASRTSPRAVMETTST